MKKLTIVMAILALVLGFAQCKKNEQKPTEQVMVPITGIIDFGGNSKTEISTAGYVTPQSGDAIYIYYNGSNIGSMTCTPQGDAQHFTCSGTIAEGYVGKECVFMYLGSGAKQVDGTDITANSDNITFRNQTMIVEESGKIKNINQFHVGSCIAEPSEDGGNVSVRLPMRTKMSIAYFHLTLDGSAVANQTIAVTGIYNQATINKMNGTLTGATPDTIFVQTNGDGEFYMALIPQEKSETEGLTFVFGDGKDHEGTKIFADGIVRNKLYTEASNAPIPVKMDYEGENWINFEFGDGLVWAKFNVGVDKPLWKIMNTNPSSTVSTDWYGEYYAWGELEPYYAVGTAYDNTYTPRSPITTGCGNTNVTAGFDEPTYCPGSTGTGNFVEWTYPPYQDNKLKHDRDIAYRHQHWLGTWRMPTGGESGEWKRLSDNTLWVYTESYKGVANLNGFVVFKVKDDTDKGKIVTADDSYGNVTIEGREYKVMKSDPNYTPNMFLPFSGRRYQDEGIQYKGTKGRYWTSTGPLGSGDDQKRTWSVSLENNSGTLIVNTTNDNSRSHGNTVRGVRPKKVVTINP